MDIEPDSIVRFISLSDETSKPRLYLTSGQLTAAIPEAISERQLVVGTSLADVFARKGTFVVSSAGPDSLRVEIKHGKVDVVGTRNPKRVPVGKGAAIMRAGFENVFLEPVVRVDHDPARTLPNSNARRDLLGGRQRGIGRLSAAFDALDPRRRHFRFCFSSAARGYGPSLCSRPIAARSSRAPTPIRKRKRAEIACCCGDSPARRRIANSICACPSRACGRPRPTPLGLHWPIPSRTTNAFASSRAIPRQFDSRGTLMRPLDVSRPLPVGQFSLSVSTTLVAGRTVKSRYLIRRPASESRLSRLRERAPRR